MPVRFSAYVRAYERETTVVVPNKGKGRLTRVADQSGSIDFVYDARGNVVKETRTIATKVHVVSYVYDLADRIVQMTYPSGRIVSYTRTPSPRRTGRATHHEKAGLGLHSPDRRY